jgi:hypothetical protein
LSGLFVFLKFHDVDTVEDTGWLIHDLGTFEDTDWLFYGLDTVDVTGWFLHGLDTVEVRAGYLCSSLHLGVSDVASGLDSDSESEQESPRHNALFSSLPFTRVHTLQLVTILAMSTLVT